MDPKKKEDLGQVPSKEEHSKPKEKEIPVIKMNDFEAVGMDEKLNLLMVAINKINTMFHHKFEDLNKQMNDPGGVISMVKDCRSDLDTLHEVLNDESQGVLPRLRDVESTGADLSQRMEALEEKVSRLENDTTLVRGAVQVHETQLTSAMTKIVDLTARSMSKNIVITGITGDNKEENCKDKVLKLFREAMQMPTDDHKVMVAHRLGQKSVGKLQPMVVKCKFQLRNIIFEFIKNLKGIKNDDGDFYYINPQCPEPIATKFKETQEEYRKIKVINAAQSDESKKIKAEIKRGTLIVNGKPMKQHIFPPTMKDILNMDEATQAKVDALVLKESAQIQEKSSKFIGLAMCVSNATEIKLAYKKAKVLFPEADHIMMAYVLKQHKGTQDCGEHGASKRILNILMDQNAVNTVVFVA